jgi:hypothetical protein
VLLRETGWLLLGRIGGSDGETVTRDFCTRKMLAGCWTVPDQVSTGVWALIAMAAACTAAR